MHEAPGANPAVNTPLPTVTPNPHPASGSNSAGTGGCAATRPFSRLNKRRVHASRRLLVASGTAGENQCAHASASTRRRERVVAVYMMIYKPASGGRCRFARHSGKLTGPRSCARPVEFLARGTSHWTLRVRMRVPAGQGYLLRSDAVDGLGHHQRHSTASVVRVRVH